MENNLIFIHVRVPFPGVTLLGTQVRNPFATTVRYLLSTHQLQPVLDYAQFSIRSILDIGNLSRAVSCIISGSSQGGPHY